MNKLVHLFRARMVCAYFAREGLVLILVFCNFGLFRVNVYDHPVDEGLIGSAHEVDYHCLGEVIFHTSYFVHHLFRPIDSTLNFTLFQRTFSAFN